MRRSNVGFSGLRSQVSALGSQAGSPLPPRPETRDLKHWGRQGSQKIRGDSLPPPLTHISIFFGLYDLGSRILPQSGRLTAEPKYELIQPQPLSPVKEIETHSQKEF